MRQDEKCRHAALWHVTRVFARGAPGGLQGHSALATGTSFVAGRMPLLQARNVQLRASILEGGKALLAFRPMTRGLSIFFFFFFRRRVMGLSETYFFCG